MFFSCKGGETGISRTTRYLKPEPGSDCTGEEEQSTRETVNAKAKNGI
jgi:hypothetical protein